MNQLTQRVTKLERSAAAAGERCAVCSDWSDSDWLLSLFLQTALHDDVVPREWPDRCPSCGRVPDKTRSTWTMFDLLKLAAEDESSEMVGAA